MITGFQAGVMGVYSDPDANAYIAAVETADGQSLESGVTTAIQTFVVGCKTDGTWSAIKASCLLAGARTLTGALIPLVGSAPTPVNLVSDDYNRKTGVIGNSTNKAINTNRAGNSESQNDKHVAFYINAATTTGKYLCSDNVNTWIGNEAGIMYVRLNSVSGVIVPGGASAVGFIGALRSNATGISVRINSTDYQYTVDSSAANTGTLYVLNSVNVAWSSIRCAFYSVGSSLNLVLLQNRISTYLSAIGTAIA